MGGERSSVLTKTTVLIESFISQARSTVHWKTIRILCLEGGSIETDGKQTLFTTTACLTAPHRNQPLSKDEIEQRLLLLFPSIERVVWIDHGELMGDDTDGHIDTILRCGPNNALLYISCDDIADPHYNDLKALDEQTRSLLTMQRQPYRLFQLPLPTPVYDEGERLRQPMLISLS